MKGVYRSFSLPDVMHFRNLLAERGIACHVRNYHAASVLGELPFLEVAPELCVLDERDVELARSVIATSGVPRHSTAVDWDCASCGEHLEAQFSECWHCGAERPPDARP